MVQWIEEHPYLTGGLVLAVVVLWVIIRNRSQASQNAQTVYSGGPSENLQALELQSGLQLQSSQLAAQTQIAGYNAATNAVQLQTAGAIANAQIGAGVQNTQTAAQLQLGLAQLGYTPSVSPFGLTTPISGVTPPTITIPGPVNTPAPTPVPTYISPTTAPVIVSSVPVSGNIPTDQQAIINAAIAQSPSAASQAFAGITPQNTGAGSGKPVNVPSVPAYVAEPGGAAIYGYTQPFTIPSSTGLTGQQYWDEISKTLNTNSFNPIDVATLTAAQTASQEDYVNNPASCHNVDCVHGVGTGYQMPTNIAPPSLFGGVASCAPGLHMTANGCSA